MNKTITLFEFDHTYHNYRNISNEIHNSFNNNLWLLLCFIFLTFFGCQFCLKTWCQYSISNNTQTIQRNNIQNDSENNSQTSETSNFSDLEINSIPQVEHPKQSKEDHHYQELIDKPPDYATIIDL